MKAKGKKSGQQAFVNGIGRALRKAAQDARRTARQWGTPIYILQDGKIVAKKP
jgi:hypothetical protein